MLVLHAVATKITTPAPLQSHTTGTRHAILSPVQGDNMMPTSGCKPCFKHREMVD